MRGRHLFDSADEVLGDPHHPSRNAIPPSANALQTRTVVVEHPFCLGLLGKTCVVAWA